MPTVLRLGKFSVRIYSNDHDPEHVHVVGDGGEVLFYLNCPDGPIRTRAQYGLADRVVNELRQQLLPHLPALCGKWEALHG